MNYPFRTNIETVPMPDQITTEKRTFQSALQSTGSVGC
jgi:hypothetical protein